MKKLILGVAALAVALIGFGGLRASTTYANPAKIWIINSNVGAWNASPAFMTSATTPNANAFETAMLTSATTRAAYLTQLDALAKDSGGQVPINAAATAVAGQTIVLVQTDGSGTNVTLNGRGLVCGTAAGGTAALTTNGTSPTVGGVFTTTAAHGLAVGDWVTIAGITSTPTINGVWQIATVPLATTFTVTGLPTITVAGSTAGTVTPFQPCNATAVQVPDTTDHITAFPIITAGAHAAGDSLVATAQQDAITLDSSTVTVVGQATNTALAVLKTSIQEGNTAAGCLITSGIGAANPTNTGAGLTFTDINGTSLVGYAATFASSSAANMVVSTVPTFVSMVQADGKTITAGNVVCGVAAGTANLTAANTVATALVGQTTAVTRTQAMTITGVPATVALTASPASIACDGSATSSVTAKVTDASGANVADGTPITFSVVALGTANPISTTTKGGEASSTITPLSGGAAGVVVIVQAGGASGPQASIRVDCLLPTATVPAAPAASPTAGAGAGITGPSTGTGGYLGQDGSAGFPMWTLIALALGSVALVAGKMVTRRAGK